MKIRDLIQRLKSKDVYLPLESSEYQTRAKLFSFARGLDSSFYFINMGGLKDGYN